MVVTNKATDHLKDRRDYLATKHAKFTEYPRVSYCEDPRVWVDEAICFPTDIGYFHLTVVESDDGVWLPLRFLSESPFKVAQTRIELPPGIHSLRGDGNDPPIRFHFLPRTACDPYPILCCPLVAIDRMVYLVAGHHEIILSPPPPDRRAPCT